MKKLTFQQLCNVMLQFNRDNNVTAATAYGNKELVGVIVFSQDSFTKEYSLESRSYSVSSQNNRFIDDKISNSIYGSALDGSDPDIRIDFCLCEWKVDYCYLIEA